MNLNFIKNLAKSRTVRRIAGAALAFLSTNVIPFLPAEIAGPYGPIINATLQAVGVGTLGSAIAARVTAKGPINSESGVRGSEN